MWSRLRWSIGGAELVVQAATQGRPDRRFSEHASELARADAGAGGLPWQSLARVLRVNVSRRAPGATGVARMRTAAKA